MDRTYVNLGLPSNSSFVSERKSTIRVPLVAYSRLISLIRVRRSFPAKKMRLEITPRIRKNCVVVARTVTSRRGGGRRRLINAYYVGTRHAERLATIQRFYKTRVSLLSANPVVVFGEHDPYERVFPFFLRRSSENRIRTILFAYWSVL